MYILTIDAFFGFEQETVRNFNEKPFACGFRPLKINL